MAGDPTASQPPRTDRTEVITEPLARTPQTTAASRQAYGPVAVSLPGQCRFRRQIKRSLGGHRQASSSQPSV
jgi:hypothetical protein